MPPLWRGADVGGRLDRVDAVIAPSRFLAGLARPSFRCPVVHLPNFAPDANPRGRVEVPSDDVLYVGVLERHKGVAELAEAAGRAPAGKRFVLVGRGSLERPLRALAQREPSRLEVRSGVGREELASLFRRAAAFIMPSLWYENAPLAAIEALSWGCPILGTSRGGVPELVRDGGAGLVLEPTVEGILGALKELEAREDAGGLRRGARKAYEGHHRPGPYVDRYLSLVRSVGGGELPQSARMEPEAGDARAEPAEEVLTPHGRHDP